MLLRLNQSSLNLIGDPHFGKDFITGVPLNRRGEREREQLALFKKRLIPDEGEGVDTIIMMGDIFDKFVVSPSIVWQVFEAYAEAAANHPEVDYILIGGNHDVSRVENLKSSFDLLTAMLDSLANVYVVKDAGEFRTRAGDRILLFSYNALTPAGEVVDRLPEKDGPYDAAFGHWDVDDFGGDNHNLVPLDRLAPLTKIVVTGHIHTPFEREVDGIKLIGTGSMMPYTFAEDPEGTLYVTHTADQVRANLAADPSFYHSKCLRILTPAGQELMSEIDCRQLVIKTLENDVTPENLVVQMENFSFKTLFYDHFNQSGLSKDKIDEVWDRYRGVNNDVSEA